MTVTDAAGNRTTRTHEYRVRYGFHGFLLPVVNPPLVNLGLAGWTFPVRFRLTDANGAVVGDPAAVAAVTLLRTCGPGAPAETTVGLTQARFDAAAGLWQFTWKTARPEAGCWAMKVRLADDSAQWLWFILW